MKKFNRYGGEELVLALRSAPTPPPLSESAALINHTPQGK